MDVMVDGDDCSACVIHQTIEGLISSHRRTSSLGKRLVGSGCFFRLSGYSFCLAPPRLPCTILICIDHNLIGNMQSWYNKRHWSWSIIVVYEGDFDLTTADGKCDSVRQNQAVDQRHRIMRDSTQISRKSCGEDCAVLVSPNQKRTGDLSRETRGSAEAI
jgi:hypothetical protein